MKKMFEYDYVLDKRTGKPIPRTKPKKKLNIKKILKDTLITVLIILFWCLLSQINIDLFPNHKRQYYEPDMMEYDKYGR